LNGIKKGGVMSLGSGLPHCWLCKHFVHDKNMCLRHEICIPIEKGYVICEDFKDVEYADFHEKNEWFVNFRKTKLLNKNALFIYSENSSYEEYIPFSELKKSRP
jgi:hypothetical protein